MAELLRYTQEWHQQQQGIHPSDYIEEAAEHNEIAELSSSLLALFKEIVLALSKQTGIPRDAQISIERSCSALILWSDGFGIAQGRLNSTFNKSRKLRYTALKNLLHIGRVLVERLVPAVDISLDKLQALCSSAELKIEAAADLIAEESCRQSDDSSSDAASTFSDDDIYEIAEDLKTDTFVLSGLDPLLKYPIFDSQHEYTVDSHSLPTWGPEKSYSDKIGNRFPHADISLTLYLGRANYERFLRCQETRESQEEEPLAIVNQEEGTQAETILANTKFHDSGVGTSIGLTMSYAETTMSYNHDGQSVRIPPLPKEAKAGSPFTCIACGRTVIITNNSAWKQHIYLDLQPYMCLDVSCPYSSSTFESRDNWISHLALDHEMGPRWASAECPLCREETGNGKAAIIKHLSKHLEEISLSALPVEVDSDAESENSPESSDASSSRNEGAHGGMDESRETLSVEFEAELASTVFSNLKDKLKAERDHKARSEAEGAALQRTAEILAAAEAENMAVQLRRTQENIEEMFKKKEYASKMAELSPIKFTDVVGREFNFPAHFCYTWQGMENLIKQAFSQVDILGPHVQEGHYDLTDPDGNIILPSVWEELVEPGLHVTMTMWPLDKAPLAGLDSKESEQPYEEKGNSEKDNSFQNNISSKHKQQHQGAQHSENVQGARIIRMSGQNFFSTAKAYFKDQPDKFTRFRVILADIATTEWVPEAWRRSCFECRVAEVECDAKAPDPCTRCRLNKVSCAVQFAAVSRQNTVVNGDQIRQGIINIGQLCEGYPSFMHELNSVMPTGYRVEVLDASTVRLFEPDNEPSIIQLGISGHSITSLDSQADFDAEPNQQGKSTSGAPNRPRLANQNSSEAAIMRQEETSHYFAQPKARTSDHPVIDQKDTPELAYTELNYVTESYMDKIKQRFTGSPHKSKQLLEILRDTQNGTRSTENAYMVAKELFGSNSDLIDDFRILMTKGELKRDGDTAQRLRSASSHIIEAPGEALTTIIEDKSQEGEVRIAVGNRDGLINLNGPQYCLCSRGSVGIMIRCDNVDGCKHKWFHLECVGLAVAPSSKDKWYCPDCRGHGNVGEKVDSNPQGLPPGSGNPEFAIDTEPFNQASMPSGPPETADCSGTSFGVIQQNTEVDQWLDIPDAALISETTSDRRRALLQLYDKIQQDLSTMDNISGSQQPEASHSIFNSNLYSSHGYSMYGTSVTHTTVDFSRLDTNHPRGYTSPQHSSLIPSHSSTNPSTSVDTWISSNVKDNLAYLEDLANFHKQKGTNLSRLPYVDKKPLDLYHLKKLVESRGGFEKVCKSKEWADIAKDLGYSGKIMSSLSTSLKNTFLRWLSPYEEYLRLAKPGVRQQLEEEHVDPGNKEKIPSIGRINYSSPNPDIYIWPPDSNVPGVEKSEQVLSSNVPPPLLPPVMAASDPTTDSGKGYNASELLSSPSDRRQISDSEYPGHEPFLASPSPSIYTKQLPPISGVSNGSYSAEIDSFDEISSLRTSPLVPSSPFTPPVSSRLREIPDRVLQCEAEPPERRLCFRRFADNRTRHRHYWSSHKEFATEQGIPDPTCMCNVCGMIFSRRDNLKRHVDRIHSNASTEPSEGAQSSTPPPSKSAFNKDDPSVINAIR